MTYTAVAVAIAAAVTALLRFLPFFVFNGKKETPPLLLYLGKVLPYAIMAMLVVYCLRATRFASPDQYLPQLIGVLIVGATYVWKRNVLLSIVGGTVCYMLLVQLVF